MLLNISHQVRGLSLSSSSLSPLPSATLCFKWSSCWRPCLVLPHWRLELMQPHSHTHASYQLIYSLGTYYYYYICFLFFFMEEQVLDLWILGSCNNVVLILKAHPKCSLIAHPLQTKTRERKPSVGFLKSPRFGLEVTQVGTAPT